MAGQLFTEEEVERIIEKSVKDYRKENIELKQFKTKVCKRWKGIFISLATVASALVILTNLSYFAISNKIDQNKKEEIVNEYGSEIATILKENKGFKADPYNASRVNVWYDTYDAAEYIKKDTDNFDIKVSDLDIKIYLAYNKIIQEPAFDDASIRKTMNALIIRLFSNGEYISFEDYVVKLRFVDKEGQADYKKYKSEMGNLINKIKSVQDTLEEHNIDETESISEGQNPGGRK